MKILLLGKQGQVGIALNKTLLALGEVMGCGRTEVNFEELEVLLQRVETYKPDVIVNAAAYTAVDKAEDESARAHRVNAHAVKILAEYAYSNQALFVHYSTDYIFDGKKQASYNENDTPNPLNVYGHSKQAGEDFILKSQCNALIFRTSWVFSPNGNNFIKTILNLARQRDELKVVNDQYGAPTSAQLIARVTYKAIAAFFQQTLAPGTFHLTAKGSTNWYDLACHIVQRAQLEGASLKLNSKNIKAIPSEEYPFTAQRPLNSRLNTDKLRRALGIEFPHWESDVNEVISQLTHQEVVL